MSTQASTTAATIDRAETPPPRLTLRQKIQKTIEAAGGNAEQAAINICLLLEWEMDLEGNGRFENDPEFEKILEKADWEVFQENGYIGNPPAAS